MDTDTTNLKRAARGFGRWYCRQGVRKDLAAQYTVTRYPQFAGLEEEIQQGWEAERGDR